MSEFKVGDRVKVLSDRFGIVKYGPVLSTFGTKTHYAVADEETGAERLYDRVDLALAPRFAVGDKVRKNGFSAEILAGPVTGANTGEDIYLYAYVDGPNAGKGGGQMASRFESIDDKPADGFEYKGVVYEYDVKYVDRDSDSWTFERSAMHGQPISDGSSCFVGESLAYAVVNYGPLTKQ